MMLLALSASPARADWVFSHYRGDTHTRANTVKIERASGQSGSNVTLGGVDYNGEGWHHPVYYGYRLSRFYENHPRVGFEFEITHAKAIADITQTVNVNGTNAPLSTVMKQFELSHGLNIAVASFAVRRPVGASHRLVLIGRAGGGLTFPHIETVFENVRRNGYQYGGPAWAVGVGAEYRIVAGLQAIADARLSTAYEHVQIGANGTAGPSLSGTFMTGHIDIGLGYRLGKRP